jgi:hypothetical protein
MKKLPFEIAFVDGADRHDLLEAADLIVKPEWPEFMMHDPLPHRLWNDLYERFPRYQFAMVRTDTGALIAAANSVPIPFQGSIDDLPETGWDWAFEESVRAHTAGERPNLQCALQIVVSHGYRGMGLSAVMVTHMKKIGASLGLEGMIAPVRPSMKHRFPLLSIDDYIRWTGPESLPADPWLRVHARLGARLIAPCHEAMRIPGTVAEWREWTGLKLACSGLYIVPGALVPVRIDLDKDVGLYIEPNVWMYHRFE